VNGHAVQTLKELLKPSLKAVIVGLNPSLTSVQAGHYWQGRHGLRMWNLLREWGIAKLRVGVEDEDAFEQGIGFADLIRIPSRSAKELNLRDKRTAVADLVDRVAIVGGSPAIIFRYKGVCDIAGSAFHERGYRILVLPSPYAVASDRDRLMREVQMALDRAIAH
jgi:TDG/mug DNA glycosylase family protein